jgi:hypothetical protein
MSQADQIEQVGHETGGRGQQHEVCTITSLATRGMEACVRLLSMRDASSMCEAAPGLTFGPSALMTRHALLSRSRFSVVSLLSAVPIRILKSSSTAACRVGRD